MTYAEFRELLEQANPEERAFIRRRLPEWIDTAERLILERLKREESGD